MTQGIPAMTAVRGQRRHRFMEAADFNGAARFIFAHLRRLVTADRSISAGFVVVEMDSATPGSVTNLTSVPLERPDLALAMDQYDDPVKSMTAGFNALLHEPESSAALIGYVGPGEVTSKSRDDGSTKGYGLCLELRSVDGSAVAVYRIQPDASPQQRLQFTALRFRGVHRLR